MTLASGGSPMFQIVVHQPLLRPSGQQCSHSGGVCPQIQGRQCGAYVGAVEEMMCVWMLQRGHSGDGCVLASTLCKYDLRKGDLFAVAVHLALWYVLLVCHQYDVCKNYVGSVYVGGYGGLSESGLCVFCELCPVCFLVVGKGPSVLL